MLEQQQAQLVTGIRELYRRLRTGEGWPGAWLEESTVEDSSVIITDKTNKVIHPLTHDILERLDLLHVRCSEDGSLINGNVGSTFLQQQFDGFDENCARLQQRLIREGASMVERRRGSQPQQKRQQSCQNSSEGPRRRKRLRTDLSHSDTCSDDDRERGVDNNEHGQNEDEEDENDGNESSDDPALVDTQTVKPRSISLSASPENLTTESPIQEKHQTGLAQNPQLLKLSNPFPEDSLPSAPPLIPTLQLTRSSSIGSNIGVSNEIGTEVNYQRHQSLPFPNQLQPFSDMTSFPTTQENQLAMTSAIKPHSPFGTGMDTAEAIRASWATSSTAAAATNLSLPSSERHYGVNDRKHDDIPKDSLHREISSAAAATKLSTAIVTTAIRRNQLLSGEKDLGSKTYQDSTPSYQNALSPTASLSTAQHSIPSPLTPLTPPLPGSRTNSADITRAETKKTANSTPITGPALTLTPSLAADLDTVDWQADGQEGLDNFTSLNDISSLDGIGGFNGFDGLTTLSNVGVANDMDMDFNRFIWT